MTPLGIERIAYVVLPVVALLVLALESRLAALGVIAICGLCFVAAIKYSERIYLSKRSLR